MLGADAADEAGPFHPVDDAGEAALAVEDPRGDLVHAQPFGRVFEVDEDVVPADREAGVALVLGKKSGLDSIRIKCAELGLEVREEQYADLLARVKQLGSEKRGLVTDEEFRQLSATL